MPEEWRIIEDFPDYEVSNLGQVRRRTDAYWGRWRRKTIRAKAGTYLLPHLTTPGYLGVYLSNNGRRRMRHVHILVCIAFHGARPSPSHQTAHGDGNSNNNFATNLRWATIKENCKDRDDHGRTIRGTKHHSAKLTPDDVANIRILFTEGVDLAVIAKSYNVTRPAVAKIQNGKSWAWLT